MNFFKTAHTALKTNRLRSCLTVSVMAIGIASIVGIQTAMIIISDRVSDSFGKMGASAFCIESELDSPVISYSQAKRFKEEFPYSSSVSLFDVCSSMSIVTYGNISTDPVVTVVASDECYLQYQMGDINLGRMISSTDVTSSSAVAVLGDNISRKLFGKNDPIGNEVLIYGSKYSVVGIIQRQGSVLGTGLDNMIIVPYTTARSKGMTTGDYTIAIVSECLGETFDDCKIEAESLMSRLRRVENPDYAIKTGDSVQSKLESISGKLSLAALVIGVITLFGAAVSLMNIMLVSVKERQIEIGVKKALGASEITIEREFITESILIGLSGAFCGTVLGVLFGNIAALIMESEMVIPYKWMIFSVAICIVVSLFSGWIPAKMAASLDPVESLRGE